MMKLYVLVPNMLFMIFIFFLLLTSRITGYIQNKFNSELPGGEKFEQNPID